MHASVFLWLKLAMAFYCSPKSYNSFCSRTQEKYRSVGIVMHEHVMAYFYESIAVEHLDQKALAGFLLDIVCPLSASFPSLSEPQILPF